MTEHGVGVTVDTDIAKAFRAVGKAEGNPVVLHLDVRMEMDGVE
jgi:hypothetical protein